MMHTFKIITANEPAVIERLLRVTRHRGYTLQSLQVKVLSEQTSIQLSVVSERPVHRLFNQLEKLYDVIKIEVSE